MLHMMTKRTLISAAVAGTFGLITLPGFSQEKDDVKTMKKPEAALAESNKEQIQEVQVTATKHSSSLLKTPIAVTAITQENLTRSGVTDVRGLSGSVPNMQISTGADSGVQIGIRGVSSNNFTEIGDPAVGLHVDGLYSPRPQGAMALMFDLEQVEVLRGPQGTLFGRNSTAGSVNIITAKPEFSETYGNTEVDLGNYNQRQINVVQNFGISDKFAVRATFMKVKRDGWVNQTQDFTDVNLPANGFPADGKPDVDQRYNTKVDRANFYNNKNEWAGRLSARLKITNDLEWQLAYEKFQNSGAGDIGLKDCEQAAGTRFACKGGQWDIEINVPGKIDMAIDTLRSGVKWDLNKSTRIEYSFSHAIQKRSQQSDDDSGYHPIDSQVTAHQPVSADGDWGVWPVSDNTSRTLNSKYVSDVHEVQFKQNFDTLQYVAGAFWMHEKNQINYAQEQLVNAPYGYPISQYYQVPRREIDAKALYAQADWKFVPTWTATLGGRFSKDNKDDKGGKVYGQNWDTTSPAYYNGLYNPGTPGEPGFRPHNGTDLTPGMGPLAGVGAYGEYGPPSQSKHSESWKHFTYRLGLMNQITPNDMVYTSLSTGYKSGGFGDQDDACGGKTCIGDTAQTPHFTFFSYGPETVTNFELGYKGKILDNRMSLSATFFYSKYKDMQVTGSYFASRIIPEVPCTSANPNCDIIEKWQTTNVGVVDIPGIEVEMDYKPWKGARLGGFFSYINTKMKDYPSFSDGWACNVREEMGAVPCPAPYDGPNHNLAGRNIYDITGNHLPLAPRATFGLNFSQNIVLDNNYVVVPWVAMKWQDKMYFTLRNIDNPHISDAQKAFTKIDASIKLISPHNWHAEAYVLNLTNTKSKNSAGDGGGFVKATWNDPRMFGVRVGFDY